jgi:hypothetical protein
LDTSPFWTRITVAAAPCSVDEVGKLRSSGARPHSCTVFNVLLSVLNLADVGLERGTLSHVSTTEELLDRKVATPV